MATLSQLIYQVRNTADRGTGNRAASFSNRQIASWINEARNFFITKQTEKENAVPVTYQQDLGCWPLTVVDQADCSAFEWGDDVKKAQFPDVLEMDRNMGLSFFGLIDKKTRIYIPDVSYGSLDDYVRFKEVNSRSGQMIGTNTVYIWGDGTKKLCTVNIRGIFKDPTLTSYYDAQGIQHCYDPDKTQYPLPGDMEGYLIERVFQTYILPFVQAPRADQANDEDNKALI